MLSMLVHVYTLDLSNTKVHDVSALKNVHELYLYDTYIDNFSALKDVHTLCLSCNDDTDLSTFNVYNLYVH
jgi:hypothetical protein